MFQPPGDFSGVQPSYSRPWCPWCGTPRKCPHVALAAAGAACCLQDVDNVRCKPFVSGSVFCWFFFFKQFVWSFTTDATFEPPDRRFGSLCSYRRPHWHATRDPFSSVHRAIWCCLNIKLGLVHEIASYPWRLHSELK